MADFLGVSVEGIVEISSKLESLPERVIDPAIDAVNEFVLNILKTYPPQKRVTRSQAYGGNGFFSDKQRRWFFAALRRGEIDTPYKRTQELRRNWKVIGEGRNSIIANETPYGPYVMGDDDGSNQQRSRHEKLAGWRTVNEIIESRITRIVQIFDGVVKRLTK